LTTTRSASSVESYVKLPHDVAFFEKMMIHDDALGII